jgi:hypothetical protein
MQSQRKRLIESFVIHTGNPVCISNLVVIPSGLFREATAKHSRLAGRKNIFNTR